MSLTLDEKQLCRSLCELYFQDKEFIGSITDYIAKFVTYDEDTIPTFNGNKLSEKMILLCLALGRDLVFETNLKKIDIDVWAIYTHVRSVYEWRYK